MRPRQIEQWALNVIDQVKNNQLIEDGRVELKAAWPDDIPKTARQLAAHANAARGDELLWLIGVDEDKGLTGADRNELANWYPQIEAQFNDLAPAMQVVNIPIDGLTIVALCFDTERRPFVVRNPCFNQPGGGQVQFEVPWREGNRTRTARRQELILVNYPLSVLPEVEVLGGQLWVTRNEVQNPPSEEGYVWTLQLNIYVVPIGREVVVIPFHRSRVTAYLPQYPQGQEFGDLAFVPGSMIDRTPVDFKVRSSCVFMLQAIGKSRPVDGNVIKMRVAADLAIAGSDRFATVGVELPRKRCAPQHLSRWAFNMPLQYPDETNTLVTVDDNWSP